MASENRRYDSPGAPMETFIPSCETMALNSVFKTPRAVSLLHPMETFDVANVRMGTVPFSTRSPVTFDTASVIRVKVS